MKFAFHLFSTQAKSFADCIDPDKRAGDRAFSNLPLKGNHGLEAAAYAQLDHKKEPKWVKFFDQHVSLPSKLQNTTNSLVFVIKRGSRFLAVTTGYGHTGLNRALIEPDFGLLVTLNSIDPQEGLKGLDARRIDNRASQKRLLLSKQGSIGDFEFDLDADMLRMVSGQVLAKKSKLGTKMAGADSLSLTVPTITLPDLGKKCDELLDAFNSKDYEVNFKFVKQLRPVKDPALLKTLNAEVETRFNDRADNLLLAYPEIEFWERDEAYKVTCKRKSTDLPDVTLEAVYGFLKNEDLKDATLDNVYVIGVNSDGDATTPRRPLYDYVVSEVDHKGQRYLLSAKRWYQLADDFVQEVETAMDNIEELDVSGLLPSTKANEKEGVYNSRAAQGNNDLVCLDKQNFTKLPGRSKVEICDLLSRHGHLFAVKRYNGSATLSHLFSQGYVSSELFHEHKPYREALKKHCPAGWPKLFDVDKPKDAKLVFVYAIAGAPDGDVAKVLPFFSKVNLRYFAKAVRRLGYQVKVARIRVT